MAERLIQEKLDPNLGRREAVDISVDVSISQQVRAENTGHGNYAINSTTESVLSLHLPDDQEIKANASLDIFARLQPFGGLEDFSGQSGMNLTEAASGDRIAYSIKDISGFVAGCNGEEVALNAVMECTRNMTTSGSASDRILAKAGADVCIHYRYKKEHHDGVVLNDI